MVNLMAFGVVVLTTISPWRTILAGGRGGTAYPVLTALVGIAFIGVGLIRQDPAPGYDPERLLLTAPTPPGLAHLAIAGVAVLASVAALLVMAARFAGDPVWRRWSLYSCGTALFVIRLCHSLRRLERSTDWLCGHFRARRRSRAAPMDVRVPSSAAARSTAHARPGNAR